MIAKPCIALAAFFALLPTPAIARLGETKEECQARYGKSVTKDVAAPVKETVYLYTANNMAIELSFNDEGKCWMIKYTPNKGNKLTDKQEYQLLSLNTKFDEKDWKSHRCDHIEWMWRTEKADKYGAVFAPSYLLIFTEAYEEASLKRKKETDAKKLSDKKKKQDALIEGL